MQIKKNIPLIFAIVVPVLTILFVAVAIYLPAFFKTPQYNFLYVMKPVNEVSDYFVQEGEGRLVQLPKERVGAESIAPSQEDKRDAALSNNLFIYSTVGNSSSAISFMEAQQLRLDKQSQSFDGFSIVEERSKGTSGSDKDCCVYYSIRGPYSSKKLNIPTNKPGYGLYFLGWIKN